MHPPRKDKPPGKKDEVKLNIQALPACVNINMVKGKVTKGGFEAIKDSLNHAPQIYRQCSINSTRMCWPDGPQCRRQATSRSARATRSWRQSKCCKNRTSAKRTTSSTRTSFSFEIWSPLVTMTWARRSANYARKWRRRQIVPLKKQRRSNGVVCVGRRRIYAAAGTPRTATPSARSK